MSRPDGLPDIVETKYSWTRYERDHPNESWAWIASQVNDRNDEDQKYLVENRSRIRFLGGIEDEDASYSFDDTAVVELDGVYYLVQAAGCSCPSHEETWGVEGKGSIAEIRAIITAGDYKGYTYTRGELFRLLAVIDAEAAKA